LSQLTNKNRFGQRTYFFRLVDFTGVSAVSIALLTIYDMVKAVDRTMVISNIHLVEKSGGRSGLYKRGVGLNKTKSKKVK